MKARGTKKRIVRFAAAALALCLCLGTETAVFAAGGKTDSEIRVQYNGEYLTFSDAKPMVAQGRTMVPYQAVMEALGGQVSWNGADRSITADFPEKQLRLRMTLGSKTLEKRRDDGVETMQMDVAPFSQNGRAYVPVKFLGDALGYTVAWDRWEQTVVIIDFDSIYGEVDQEFSILGKLIESEAVSTEEEKAISERMKIDVQGEISQLPMGDLFYMSLGDSLISATLSLAGTLNRLSFQGKTDMTAEGDLFGDVTVQLDRTTLKGSIDTSMELQAYADGLTGDVYVKGTPLENEYWMPADEKDCWIHMGMEDLGYETGIDSEILWNMLGKREGISTLAFIQYITGVDMKHIDTETYDQARIGYTVVRSLIGDKAFHKEGSAWVAELNPAAIERAVRDAIGLSWMGGLSEIMAMDLPEDVELDGRLVVRETSAEMVDSWAMTVDMAFQEALFSEEKIPIRVSLDMHSGRKGDAAALTLTLGSYAHLTAKAESARTVESRLPQGKPGDAEKVLEYDELRENMFNQWEDRFGDEYDD